MMKKFVVILCLALICCGCGSSKSADTKLPNSESNPAITQQEPSNQSNAQKSDKQLKFEAESRARKEAFEQKKAEIVKKQEEIRQHLTQ